MRDLDKTKEQLIAELDSLRRQLAQGKRANAGTEFPLQSGREAINVPAGPASATDSHQLLAILSATIECLPFEFFAIGPDGRYILQNAVLREHYGDAIGRRPEHYAADDATRQLWLDNNRRAWAGERVEGEIVASVRGETRYVYNIITPIRANGAICGILGVNIDITERKLAELELQNARDDLERRVEARTTELREGNAILEREIAERRQAEEQAKNANRQLVDTLESIADGVVSFDHEWRYTFVNEAAARHFHKSPEELLGKVVWDYWPEIDQTAYIQSHRAVQDNVSVHFEKFYPEPLNRWYECHAFPNSKGLTTYFRDVTDRREAERVIRESEAQYRGLVEACPDAVVMSDLGGKIFFASPQTWNLLDLAPSVGLVDRSVFEFVIERDRQRLAAHMAEVIKTGTRRNTEYTALRSDGTTVPVEASSAVIYNEEGQPKALMAVIRNIVKRKKTEEAFRQASDRLLLATRSAKIGIWDFDVLNNRLVWDESMFQIYGVTADMFAGAYDAWTAGVHPQDRDRADEEVQMALRGEKEFDTEFRVVWPDKSIHWIKANGTVQRDAAGQAVRMIGVNWDFTDRRQAHETLQRQHQTLKHLLDSSDHERQLIAYEIHDGLAQQLAGAIMQFEAFEHLRAARPDEAQAAYEAGRALLKQGHFESRRLIAGVRPPILDESGVVEAIRHFIHEQDRDKGPKVIFLSDVTFDRLCSPLENAIYRIVQEGVANACQHSNSDEVHVRLWQRGDWIRIEIRDRGRGFDTNAARKQRFGLEGIRQRAKLLGGKCRIVSLPGKGTKIVAQLPLFERNVK